MPSPSLSLLLYSLTAAAAEQVACTRWEFVVEDFYDTPTPSDARYGLCHTREGATLFVETEGHLSLESLSSASTALLDVEVVRSGEENAALSRARSASPAPAYVRSGAPLYRVAAVIEGAPPKPQAPRSASDERDLITIRMVYTDESPTYCDENCVRQGMWGSAAHGDCVYIYGYTVCGSVDGGFQESSYGKMSWPEASGTVISVDMGKPAPTNSCTVHTEMALADQRAVDLGLATPSSYTHREYFVPQKFGTCTWGGYAVVGCAEPGTSFSGGACWSMIRDAYPTTRLHEFGHNIGLLHAGLPPGSAAEEYGDDSSLMGSARAWKGFNAPHRFQLGWLDEGHVATVGASGLFTLRPVHDTPSTLGSRSGLYFSCPTCISGYSGSQIWISFRDGSGYDADLPSDLINRVYVHVRKLSSDGTAYGTKLWASPLAEGGSHMLTETGHAIRVCSISGGEAVVAVTQGSADIKDPMGHAYSLCTENPAPPSSPPPPPLPRCKCTSTESPTSGGVAVGGKIGCEDHLGDGQPFCYVVNPGCEGATPSGVYQGAEWIFCDANISPPPSPPPSPLPSPPPSPPAIDLITSVSSMFQSCL